jgi:hypothetical protein
MTKKEFRNLKVGEKVVITVHGRNQGKIGIVKYIGRDQFGLGLAYLEPFECEFEMYPQRGLRNADGLCGWNHYGIAYLKKGLVDEEELRNWSLELKFVGSNEELEEIKEEIKRIVKEIAPKANLTIYKE